MFDDFATISKSINLFKENYLDDFVDILNYRIGCYSLLAAMLMILTKQFVHEPFICYYATDVGGHNLDDYIESYCFVEGTIPITENSTIPTNNKDWLELSKKEKLVYYQWVPLVFGLQALLFYFPHVIWRMLNHSTQRHSDIKRYVSQVKEANKKEGSARKEHVMKLAGALNSLVFHHDTQQFRGFKKVVHVVKSFCLESHRSGFSTFTIYVFIKLFYFINSILQLIIMNYFIANNKRSHGLLGYSIVLDILKGKPWQKTLVFPRVSYCVVPIRQVQGMNYVIAQCSLPVNMLNEKIYVFLWIFITAIVIINFLSFLQVLFLGYYRHQRASFIERFLKLSDAYRKKDSKYHTKLKRFESVMMKNDGVFILDLMSRHCGDIITGEIVKQLFDKFLANEGMDASKKGDCCQFDEKPIIPLCKPEKSKVNRPNLEHSKTIPHGSIDYTLNNGQTDEFLEKFEAKKLAET